MPPAVGFEDIEVVFAVAEFHAREWEAFLAANDLQLSVLISWFVASEELVVFGEISNHVLRRVGAKHFRHAGLRRVAVNPAVTSAAEIRACIRRQFLPFYDWLLPYRLG